MSIVQQEIDCDRTVNNEYEINNNQSDDNTYCASYLRKSSYCTYQQNNGKSCSHIVVKNSLCRMHLNQCTRNVEEQCTFVQKNGKCRQRLASDGLCCLHLSQFTRKMIIQPEKQVKVCELPPVPALTSVTKVCQLPAVPALISVTKLALIIEQTSYDCVKKFDVGGVSFSHQFVFMNMNFELKVMNGLHDKLKSAIEQDFSRLQFKRLNDGDKDFLQKYLMSIAYNSEGYVLPQSLWCQTLVSQISGDKCVVSIVFSPYFRV